MFRHPLEVVWQRQDWSAAASETISHLEFYRSAFHFHGPPTDTGGSCGPSHAILVPARRERYIPLSFGDKSEQFHVTPSTVAYILLASVGLHGHF